MISLQHISPESVASVCARMRDADAREIFNLRPHDSAPLLAHEVCGVILNHGVGVVAWHGDKPAAVAGFAEYWPGTWQAIMFGTDDFPLVAKACVRWMLRTKDELVSTRGLRRLQCETHLLHWDAHEFLRRIGARCECSMPCYGKDGSTYLRFVKFYREPSNVLFEARHRQHAHDNGNASHNAERA